MSVGYGMGAGAIPYGNNGPSSYALQFAENKYNVGGGNSARKIKTQSPSLPNFGSGIADLGNESTVNNSNIPPGSSGGPNSK